MENETEEELSKKLNTQMRQLGRKSWKGKIDPLTKYTKKGNPESQ